MRTLIIYTISIVLCSPVFSTNNITIDFLLSISQLKVPSYVADTTHETPFIVRMNFDGDTILNKEVIRQLRGVIPERIDLVYTDFRRSFSFDQPKLNRDRLEALFEVAPNLFQYEMTDWRFFGQTRASTLEKAETMFHGFVIYPLKRTAKEEVYTEMSFVDMVLDSAVVYASEHDSTCVVERTRSRTMYVPTGEYASRRYFYKKKGKLSPVKTRRHYISYKVKTQTFYTVYDTIKCHKSSYIDDRVMSLISDSTILKTFERNQQWHNKLVIADITGSMSPYSSQLAVWFKLRENLADVEQFVFFNDGDNKPDRKKVLGKTGGIYQCTGRDGFDEMYNTMKMAMSRGSGGDSPENDVEAIISGINNCDDCDEVILIADNWAPVKDISLLAKITKPVRIILCGAQYGIFNSDYLQLARTTGGSIHTMEHDITDLMKLNEGEKVKLGKREYVISNGKFEIVKSL